MATDIDVLLRISGNFALLYTRMVTMRAPFADIIQAALPERYVLEWLSNYKPKLPKYSSEGDRILLLYPSVDMLLALIGAKAYHGTPNIDALEGGMPRLLEQARASPKLAAQLLTQPNILTHIPMPTCYMLCGLAITRPQMGTADSIKYLTPEYMEAAGYKNKSVTGAHAWNAGNYRMAEHIQAATPLQATRMIRDCAAYGHLPTMRRQMRLFPSNRSEIIAWNIIYFRAEHFAEWAIDAAHAKRLLKTAGIYGYVDVVRRLHAIIRS